MRRPAVRPGQGERPPSRRWRALRSNAPHRARIDEVESTGGPLVSLVIAPQGGGAYGPRDGSARGPVTSPCCDGPDRRSRPARGAALDVRSTRPDTPPDRRTFLP